MRAPLSLFFGLAALAAACTPRPGEDAEAPPPPEPVPVAGHAEAAPGGAPTTGAEDGTPAAAGGLPGAAAATDAPADAPNDTPTAPAFGEPVRVGPLTVYPITLDDQVDPGPIISLEQALERGVAEVREVSNDAPDSAGAAADEPDEATAAPNRRRHLQARAVRADVPPEGDLAELVNEVQQVQVQARGNGLRQVRGGGATVGTLVIENKGDAAIFVLAGTVVKGGNQDRQIGQDFVVDAGQTVPVDAFCVERGRWNDQRDGAATAGQFAAAGVLATSKVRAAGQYKSDQGEVWANVSKANAAHAKSHASDSLFATLDDPEVRAKLDALAADAGAALGRAADADALVGFAYAIDGRLQGARVFSHRRVFGLFRDQLLRTAAIDALTAEAAASAEGRAIADVAPPKVATLDALVAEIDAEEPAARKATAGSNDNIYQESERVWSSKTVLRAADTKARPLAVDYLVK